LFVVGEAGLGKTAALESACGLAEERGFAVGVGRSNAMESALPFGVFAEALASLGGREVFEREALDLPGPDVRAVQFYAALRWLEGFATAPVLLLWTICTGPTPIRVSVSMRPDSAGRAHNGLLVVGRYEYALSMAEAAGVFRR
jgi:hypothetical protein